MRVALGLLLFLRFCLVNHFFNSFHKPIPKGIVFAPLFPSGLTVIMDNLDFSRLAQFKAGNIIAVAALCKRNRLSCRKSFLHAASIPLSELSLSVIFTATTGFPIDKAYLISLIAIPLLFAGLLEHTTMLACRTNILHPLQLYSVLSKKLLHQFGEQSLSLIQSSA